MRCGQHVELELAILEDVEVGHEDDGRAGLVGVRERAARDQLGRRIAACERLRVLDAVAVDREVEVLAERVHDRHADAVEPAGDLVALAAELAAGMQLRQHDGGRGQALVLHHVDGDPTAVVVDRDGSVRMERDLDLGGVAGERFVDAVVEDLEYQMMESAMARRADVHSGPFAHCLESLEDGDVLRAVVRFRHSLPLVGIVVFPHEF